MITYRLEKGYDLTHEELDQNFREFDDAEKVLSVGDVSCPEGDKYVFDVAFGTDKSYSLIGESPYTVGEMGADTINIPFTAIVANSTQYDHIGKVVPLDISGFNMVEEIIEARGWSDHYDFWIEFAQEVDLLEVEWNVDNALVENWINCTYSDGEIVNPSSAPSTLITYYSRDLKVECNVIAQLTIPTTWNDLDPFGDGSQVHYFKFENNLVDEMGNGTITGNASFTNHALVGSNALKCVYSDPLSLDLHNVDFLVNGGYSFTCGFSHSATSDVLHLLENPPNVAKSSEIVTFVNANSTLKGIYHHAQHFFNFLSEYTTVTEYVHMVYTNLYTIWKQKCSDNQICYTTDPQYGMGYKVMTFNNGITTVGAGGWSWIINPYDFLFKPPTRDTGLSTVEVPTTLEFMRIASWGAEAEIDELRIFNRPLKESEGYMLSNLASQVAPDVWSTDGGLGITDVLGTPYNFGFCMSAYVMVNDVKVLFGAGTANHLTKKN